MSYNGYTNYETWLVALHIDNSEGDQEYWRDRARWCVKHHDAANDHLDARCELAGELRDAMYEKYEEQRPESAILCDMLSGALGEVNWHEIAQLWVDEVTEEVSNAEASE